VKGGFTRLVNASYTAMSRRRPLERHARHTQEVNFIDEPRLRRLLDEVKTGEVTTEAAVSELRSMPFSDLGFAKVDHHRALRTGFPEVVFGQGKTPSQVAILARELLKGGEMLLVTRTSSEAFEAVAAEIPDATYDETARTIVVDRRPEHDQVEGIVVASGGTSDAPVAREAVITAELMGCRVTQLLDVGVAGLHRLLDSLDVLQGARVVVAVAGMEGALPSVVGGLVEAPVIAVPTSVGYGASFGGMTALLAMLNSCAPGVSVVNIDNGFGAGYLAAMIARGA
jgi:pyridinium-3,5-biscarboxylic acid mononucleotide synthase